MSQEIESIKFIGRVYRRMPQFFPKNNMKFENSEYAVLNFTVVEALDGDVEDAVTQHGTISIGGFCFPPDYTFDKDYTILANLKEINSYGKQWSALMCNEIINISDVWQQKIFFQTFLTDNQIKNMFEAYDNPLELIENGEYKKLEKVKGMGEITVKSIIQRYEANKDYAEAYIELAKYGMTPFTIKKLVDIHGSASVLINKIKADPYILASEVKGMGFTTVDDMALRSGIPRMSQRRLRAFVKYILEQAAMVGYSWISSQVLIDRIEEDLDIFPMSAIGETIAFLKEQGIVWDGVKGVVALQSYYDLEMNIKKELDRILDGENSLNYEGWEDRVKEAEILQGWKYTEEQMDSIQDIMNRQIDILTAKAGAGKTATVLGALKAIGDKTITFAQCALSGRASARMEESTGYPASTIHRLLGFNPSGFTKENPSAFMYNSSNQLNLDIVILDEFPMVGGRLFLNLLEAIPTGAKLVLIGDDGQLPAIGALNVGNDLINCKRINTSYLTIIHRQAAKSAIKLESYKVAESIQIVEDKWYGKELRGELKDLELDIYRESYETMEKVMFHFKEKLEMSGNDVMEVQIISPITIKSTSSVYDLNNAAQKIYNPEEEDKVEVYNPINDKKGYTLRIGDKVINMSNNYKMVEAEQDDFFKPRVGLGQSINNEKWTKKQSEGFMGMGSEDVVVAIFNGYMGVIKAIQGNDLIIYFPMIGKTCIVPQSHWKGGEKKGIHLAYAITCHKIQGSQCKYGIVALDSTHYSMFSREYLYTAMTRASIHCVIVAENHALSQAISITAVKDKQTFLIEMLDDESEKDLC